MNWDYEITAKALKQLRKLGPEASRRILAFLDSRIAGTEDPRQFGKCLSGSLAELWRYRVENYRVICKLEENKLVVLVVRIGNRRDVYD